MTNTVKQIAGYALGAVSVTVASSVLLGPPIAQDPGYHRFADHRTLLGVPNLLNVATNAPFAIVGAIGLWKLMRCNRERPIGAPPAPYVLFAAVFLVAFGSSYYHLEPDNCSLFWTRLPMAA